MTKENIFITCCNHISAFTMFTDPSMLFNPTGQTNEVFHWMPKEHLCILVYLVSVYHAVQAGQIDKAQNYSEKALTQIQGLKCKLCLFVGFLLCLGVAFL